MTRIRPISSLVGGQGIGKPLFAPVASAGASPSASADAGAVLSTARTAPQGAARPSNFDLSRDELVRAIEAGVLDPVSTFGQVAQWPTSATNGRPYHGLNVLTLANTALEKGYPSGQWCTFEGAKSRGWSVRKGEQHTKVFFFRMVARDTGEIDEETQEPILESYPRLEHFKVFNVAQMDIGNGQKPQAPKGVLTGSNARQAADQTLERIANHMGYEVHWDTTITGEAVVSDDSIHVASPAQLGSALLRMSVSEGVVVRTKPSRQPDTAEQGAQRDAEKRLVQKMAEAMLSLRLGIDISGERFEPADIQTALDGRKSVAIAAAGHAEQAVSYMLAFDPELQDDLVAERRAMYDEILDAGGDEVVFDASTLGLDQVEPRTRPSRNP